MPPIADPVLPVASALLVTLNDHLEVTDAPICQIGFAFGSPPPADNCCGCSDFAQAPPVRSGSAWVRVGSMWATSTFPQLLAGPVADYGCTTVGLAATFTLGVWRCAPTMDDAGRPPTGAQLADALVRQTQDAAVLRNVIAAALGPGGMDLQYLPGTWDPIEPGGGCMGGMTTVTVLVADGNC